MKFKIYWFGGGESIILLFITDFLSATTTLIFKKLCVNTVTIQIAHIIMARHIREVKDFQDSCQIKWNCSYFVKGIELNHGSDNMARETLTLWGGRMSHKNLNITVIELQSIAQPA